MRIVIQRNQVCIGEVWFASPPSCDDFKQLFAETPREFRKGPAYLPVWIFDESGVAARYRPETHVVALVDVFFATAGRDFEPKSPFQGEVILNGQTLTRPISLKELVRKGDFNFDDKSVPVAGTDSIGVSLVPKFEYLGVINFGWKTDLD